jgi:hypothetical protein
VLVISDGGFGAELLGLVLLELGGVRDEGEGDVAVLEGGGFGDGRGGFLRLLLFGLMIRYAIKIYTFRFFTVKLL